MKEKVERIETNLSFSPELAIPIETEEIQEFNPQVEVLVRIGEMSRAKEHNVRDSMGSLHS